MSDEKKEPWLNWLALTTVLLAVGATLSSFKGSSYSTRAVMSQTRAADQWAFYQAKSIKGYLYEIRKEELETDRSTDPAALARNRAAAARADERIARYERERADIQAQARRYEQVRDDAVIHSQTFGYAVIYLQIGVLLSSVAALLRKRPLWYVGMVSGALGAWHFTNGFFLLGR